MEISFRITIKEIEIMQDFIDQANKNGVTLLDNRMCQFCGADFQRGIFECMDNGNNGFEHLDFNDAEYHLFRFLNVDPANNGQKSIDRENASW